MIANRTHLPPSFLSAAFYGASAACPCSDPPTQDRRVLAVLGMTEGIASNPRLSSGPVPVRYVAAQMVACPWWHGRTMSNSSALPTVRMTLSAPPLNDLDHNHDDRNYQEDMYKSSK